MPIGVSAHAELEMTTPADGSTVEGTPDEVVATFTEAVDVGRSSLELRSADGTLIASGAADPANPLSLRIPNPELASGAYEVRITWFSADGHEGPERATFTFTVTAPPPTPTPPPTPAPSATLAPPPSPTPTSAATPSATPSPSAVPSEPTGGTGDVLIPILAALVLIGAFGAWLLRRRGGSA